MFKICSNLIHGTRGQLNQINENLATQQELFKRMEKLMEEAHDSRLKAFLLTEYKKKAKTDQLYFASNFYKDKSPRKLIETLINLNNGSDQDILVSDRALVYKKSKISLIIYKRSFICFF
jgi:hypothetical protein